MSASDSPPRVAAQLLRAFGLSLVIPAGLLLFFYFAPGWLNQKLHRQVEKNLASSTSLSPGERRASADFYAGVDFVQVAYDCPPELLRLRGELANNGVLDHFLRLRWGFSLSAALIAILVATAALTLVLSRLAQSSPLALIRSYRLGWTIGMIGALAQVFVLLPLLTYAAYQATALAADKIYLQLLAFIVIGGGLVLWTVSKILLQRVPLEFTEGFARAVTPDEAPELWQAVREAATRLRTAPPDHIVIGLQLNFYVTELALNLAGGRIEGRTLFLSQPVLRQLPPEEILAIVGHELGHFMGDDTRLTREFYPLRFKVDATIATLAASPVGWASRQSLTFFFWCFGAVEHKCSRARELLADRIAAELTSPATMARALTRLQIVSEAFDLGFQEALRNRATNPLDLAIPEIVRAQLLPKAAFWRDLFESKAPHPLDTHPALHVRLAALGQPLTPDDAKALALIEGETAHVRWLSGREALFTDVHREAEQHVAHLRDRVAITDADIATETGRALLNQHFPEQRFHSHQGRFWLLTTLCAVALVIGLCVTFLHDNLVFAIVGGVFAAMMAAVIWSLVRQYYRVEFVLRAEGIEYGGWRRPLQFADVEKITYTNHNSIAVTFHLKSPQSPFWKASLFRFPRKTLTFSPGCIDAKPELLTGAILRYYAREPAQTEG